MQERRIFPEELRKLNISGIVVAIALIAVLLFLSWTVSTLFPEEVYIWVLVLFQYAGLAVLVAYIVKSWKSSARPMVPGKTHFEARVFDRVTLPLITILVLMSFMSLTAPVSSFLEGNYEHLQLLVSGLIWPAAIVLIVIRAFRLRFSVEENGLVLRDSMIPSMPPKFIPFEELIYLNVEGRTLVYRGRSKSVLGKLIVRYPVKLKAVLREVYRG